MEEEIFVWMVIKKLQDQEHIEEQANLGIMRIRLGQAQQE